MRSILFLFSLFLFISGCSSETSSDGDLSEPYAGKLIRSTLVGEYTSAQSNTIIVDAFESTGADLTELLRTSTDTKAYSIEYYTPDVDGELVIASGLVAFPADPSGIYPVIQYHHGTQFNNADVPSNVQLCHEAPPIIALFAAHGYIASMPDYLGQGKSAVSHPYLYASAYASADSDMLKAVNELCVQLKVKRSGKLFICGLSEGGYATLALQRFLEMTETDQPFELAASAPVAGPYNIPFMWNYLQANNPPGSSPLLAHLVMSYRKIYGITDTLAEIFVSPYDVNILTIDDGTHNGEEMYLMLPKTAQEMFVTSFLNKVNDGIHPIYKDFEENNVDNFVPESPTRLLHSTGDELLPYTLSIETCDKMKALGAPNIELVNLGNYQHVPSFGPSMIYSKQWFDTLK
jgi:pimeloyl-ACP methyl ester carboxylesterase